MNKQSLLTSENDESTYYDLRIFSKDRLTEISRKRVKRLIKDLNQEITKMPSGYSHPFQIVREILIELVGE